MFKPIYASPCLLSRIWSSPRPSCNKPLKLRKLFVIIVRIIALHGPVPHDLSEIHLYAPACALRSSVSEVLTVLRFGL